jgi:hypothetical protein
MDAQAFVMPGRKEKYGIGFNTQILLESTQPLAFNVGR